MVLISRRRFLQAAFAGSALAGLGVGVYAWRIEPHWIDVVVRDLPIRHLPATLEGRTQA